MSQLRKNVPKKLMHEPISVFHAVVFGKDNAVYHFMKKITEVPF